jgi:hypothetical protein
MCNMKVLTLDQKKEQLKFMVEQLCRHDISFSNFQVDLILKFACLLDKYMTHSEDTGVFDYSFETIQKKIDVLFTIEPLLEMY